MSAMRYIIIVFIINMMIGITIVAYEDTYTTTQQYASIDAERMDNLITSLNDEDLMYTTGTTSNTVTDETVGVNAPSITRMTYDVVIQSLNPMMPEWYEAKNEWENVLIWALILFRSANWLIVPILLIKIAWGRGD